MSGLLDNKTRILDVILTEQGRRSLSQNDMTISYYSFTDGSTFYEADIVSGSSDATKRIYLEAFSSQYDQIIPVSDAFGQVELFKTTNGIIASGKVKNEITLPAIQTTITGGLPTGSYELLSSASLGAIKGLQLIGSYDDDFVSGDFSISPDITSFNFYYESQITSDKRTANINSMPSIFYDKHFAEEINFKFLPPKQNGIDFGFYENFSGFDSPPTFDEIVGSTVSDAKLNGNIISLEFDQTSSDNNLVCQVFETSGSNFTKLILVDGGDKLIDNKMNKVFYAGKAYMDDRGNYTFARIFTFLFFN
jgi:hypothetical protein